MRVAPLAISMGLLIGGCDSSQRGHQARSGSEPPSPPAADSPPSDEGSSQSFSLGGGEIAVTIADGLPVSSPQVIQWIRTGARAVTGYFGRFPVRKVRIEVSKRDEPGIGNGVTYDGRLIRIAIGPGTRPLDLPDDWIMTHEVFHLAFPNLDESHNWMNEGLSTYLEPIARVRIGNLSARQMWGDVARDLPQGLPEPGDKGLDRTHTWGRTYWGGCLFWLLADVQIREQTHNTRSLDDALRAILNAGGDGSQRWEPQRVASVGDKATGTSVLKDLYDQMAFNPVTSDLNSLWNRLGVRGRGDDVSFDDAAPLAAIRKSMTAAVDPPK